VGAIKSENNQAETLSNDDLQLIQWEGVRNRLDHLDVQLHELDQKITQVLSFIDEHKPALARGMALMDPAAKLRGAFARGKRSGSPDQVS
jgi:hypothetical protein